MIIHFAYSSKPYLFELNKKQKLLYIWILTFYFIIETVYFIKLLKENSQR